MKDIVSLVCSINPARESVIEVINELNKFSDVVLFTTGPHSLPVFSTQLYDPSIGRNLVYEPRRWILDNLDDQWQYALYNEDDILIPEESLNQALSLYEELPRPFIPGFIRYDILT